MLCVQFAAVVSDGSQQNLSTMQETGTVPTEKHNMFLNLSASYIKWLSVLNMTV